MTGHHCPNRGCAHLAVAHVPHLADDSRRCSTEGCRCGHPEDPSADVPPTVAMDGRVGLPGRP